MNNVTKEPLTAYTPAQLLDIAIAIGPNFKPGASWVYIYIYYIYIYIYRNIRTQGM